MKYLYQQKRNKVVNKGQIFRKAFSNKILKSAVDFVVTYKLISALLYRMVVLKMFAQFTGKYSEWIQVQLC